ncbi:MAG: DUF3800 domain-containing protein [Stellaceae bacterium]
MYRLYIDETGNADLKASQRDPNHRFLSLSGVAMSLDYARRVAYPKLEDIKAEFFQSHPDHPIVLHRKDLIQKNHPFHALRDPETDTRFGNVIFSYLRTTEFKAITVVIDKQEHLNRYKVWQYDPYHYCLEILVERYFFFLRDNSAVGDVMAEVRGGKPDRKLEKLYHHFFTNGTSYLRASVLQRYLSSKDLKMRPKSANVTGLQIADLIAAPSAQYVKATRRQGKLPDRFGARIVKLLREAKYLRDHNGIVAGCGTKWLP